MNGASFASASGPKRSSPAAPESPADPARIHRPSVRTQTTPLRTTTSGCENVSTGCVRGDAEHLVVRAAARALRCAPEPDDPGGARALDGDVDLVLQRPGARERGLGLLQDRPGLPRLSSGAAAASSASETSARRTCRTAACGTHRLSSAGRQPRSGEGSRPPDAGRQHTSPRPRRRKALEAYNAAAAAGAASTLRRNSGSTSPRPRYLLGRAGGDQLAARLAALRPEVHDPVRLLDHVQVVLDHEHGVALVDEPLQHLEQLAMSAKCRPVVGSSRM